MPALHLGGNERATRASSSSDTGHPQDQLSRVRRATENLTYGGRPTAPLLAKEGTSPPAHKHLTPQALSSSPITLWLLLLVPCSHRCRQTSPWARICQSPPPRAWASLKAQMVKNLPAMQETGVGSLGGEDPLEKGMAIHSSIFAWKIPWTEGPGRQQPMGSQKSWTRFSD